MKKQDKKPDVISVSDQELEQLKTKIKDTNLNDSEKKIVLTILDTYYWLAQMYRAKKLSLNKLRRLFSFKTEKSPKDKNSDDEDPRPPAESGNRHGKGKGGKNLGQGRNGEKDLPGAKRLSHKLEGVNKGDKCPECSIGKLYPVAPGTHIQFTGESPIQATVHETEKLRCNACGHYFEAYLPPEYRRKYHPSADVAIATQKYALGLPFYRTGKWQNGLGIPIPASTQWDRCEVLLESVYPVFERCISLAADGDILHGDDTGNKILELQHQLREEKAKRTGIYTTGIVSKAGKRIFNLFFTGNHYAGENLDKILQCRARETKAVIMSDALSWNLPKKVAVLWANCMTHARRYFYDYRKEYPKMVGYVLSLFRKIYHYDAIADERGLSPEERLRYHQKKSGPVIDKLRRWGLKYLYLKKIEPNEELGDALKYFFKHFKELTLFLRIPGVPLCNNIVERLLKTPILNRKNSYFYKTQFGALVGDVMMSLIETCKSAGKNPQRYLLALHENASWVKASPEQWLPWNYEANLPG